MQRKQLDPRFVTPLMVIAFLTFGLCFLAADVTVMLPSPIKLWAWLIEGQLFMMEIGIIAIFAFVAKPTNSGKPPSSDDTAAE